MILDKKEHLAIHEIATHMFEIAQKEGIVDKQPTKVTLLMNAHLRLQGALNSFSKHPSWELKITIVTLASMSWALLRKMYMPNKTLLDEDLFKSYLSQFNDSSVSKDGDFTVDREVHKGLASFFKAMNAFRHPGNHIEELEELISPIPDDGFNIKCAHYMYELMSVYRVLCLNYINNIS